jgi:glycerophosphoryl diester phosphodiesterase
VAAVADEGFDAISPAHGYPFALGAGDPSYVPFASAELIARAHDCGLQVLPYTVDLPATMHALLDAGVDGMITNYPDRLRTVLAERGLPLPTLYPGLSG